MAAPDELAYVRLERDAAREHVIVMTEFIANLEEELARVCAHRDTLIEQLAQFERLKSMAKRVPGHKILATTVRRWFLQRR